MEVESPSTKGDIMDKSIEKEIEFLVDKLDQMNKIRNRLVEFLDEILKPFISIMDDAMYHLNEAINKLKEQVKDYG